MRLLTALSAAGLSLVVPAALLSQPITAAGQSAQLDIRASGESSIRITLKPLSYAAEFPFSPGVAERSYPTPALTLREIRDTVSRSVGSFGVEIRPEGTTRSVDYAGQRLRVTF